jgi:hypothetical protein
MINIVHTESILFDRVYCNTCNPLELTTDFKYLDEFDEIRTDTKIVEVLTI